MTRLVLVIAGSCLPVLVAACDTGTPAAPAAPDAGTLPVVVVDGAVATDASAPSDAGADAGGDAGHGYDTACIGEGAGNCDPGFVCFEFNKFGSRCTIPCDAGDVCIALDAGSKSCATKGVCRPPEATQ